MQSITVFCGSAFGRDPAYKECAIAFGRELGTAGKTLVYGGGGIGLMGELARAVKQAGGRVVGVMTQTLVDHEQSWNGCDELVVVDCMRTRKAMMDERGDAFVALPGGLGTYDELLEAITGRVVDRHRKPIGLLDSKGFFAPFLELVSHGVAHGFVRESTRSLILAETEPALLLRRLGEHRPKLGPMDLLPMHGAAGSPVDPLSGGRATK